VRTPSEDRDWPGAAPRVPGEGDVEEALRRALRAAVENVEPAGDGLARIFRRVAVPWLVRQVWLLATDCADLLRLITIWLAAAGGSVHEALRRLTSRAPAAAPISAGRHPRGQARDAVSWGRAPALKARARAAIAWLRPAMPVAVTAVLVLTGTVALSQTVARIDLSGGRGNDAPALGGAAPAADGHRKPAHRDRTGPNLAQVTPAWPGTTPASGRGATHQHSCAATRCLPGPAGAPPSGPAATPSAQPTASPSPSPVPSPTPTRSHHHPHPHPSHHPHPPHPGPSGPGQAGTPTHGA
jgi:hypothetical protein